MKSLSTQKAKEHMVMVIGTLYAGLLVFTTLRFGYIPYILLMFMSIFIWVKIKKLKPLKMKDESTYYIIALIYCGIAITVASLSYEEIQSIIKNISFEQYFWTKLFSNIFGWVFLACVTAQLVKIVNSPQTNQKIIRSPKSRSFYQDRKD